MASSNSRGPRSPAASQSAPPAVMAAKSDSVRWMCGVKSCTCTHAARAHARTQHARAYTRAHPHARTHNKHTIRTHARTHALDKLS